MMDPVSVYNPSVMQYNPEDDEDEDEAELARQEAEEQRELEQDIENEMGDLSGPALDDSEEESVFEDRQQQPPLRTEATTPYTSSHFSANEEKVLLYGEQGHLQVLYDARGQEMGRLQAEIGQLRQRYETENRSLKHQLTLLKAEKAKLDSNLEYHKDTAQVQSEENRKLRQEIEDLKAANSREFGANSKLNSELDSQNMLIQTLQMQIQELQRSDTILRQKTQHEETLRSLKERSEAQEFQMRQEIDRLNSDLRKCDLEKENCQSKLRKIQGEFEKINLEKSDIIKNLQDRLDLSQRKVEQIQIQNSSVSQGTEIAKRYQLDKEKFAVDLIDKQEEIDSLKSQLKYTKESETNLETKLQKLKIEFQTQISHKDDLITNLNSRLNESERKISELMRESLSGTTNAAVRRLNEELEKLKQEGRKKDSEIVTLKSEVNEAKVKYQCFKKKVKEYQSYTKKKEEKYKEFLKNTEDEFRSKVINLRDQMQESYDAKLFEVKLFNQSFKFCLFKNILQIETEMKNVQKFVMDEMAEAKPLEPPPRLQAENDENRSSTDALTKLLQDAKMDVREKLKRPSSQERQPFTHVNNF